MTTPSMEDYLETIYKLLEQKGYARVADIADILNVLPSSVTKMIQKLDKDQYVIYEKYKEIILTEKGKKIGKKLVERHLLLENFLRIIGVNDEGLIYNDVEGIEHHLSSKSIFAIESLVKFLESNQQIKEQFRLYQNIIEHKED